LPICGTAPVDRGQLRFTKLINRYGRVDLTQRYPAVKRATTSWNTTRPGFRDGVGLSRLLLRDGIQGRSVGVLRCRVGCFGHEWFIPWARCTTPLARPHKVVRARYGVLCRARTRYDLNRRSRTALADRCEHRARFTFLFDCSVVGYLRSVVYRSRPGAGVAAFEGSAALSMEVAAQIIILVYVPAGIPL
jgi:hypothetical protein